MKTTFVILFSFFAFFEVAIAQSIPSYWLNTDDLYLYYKTRSNNVQKMTVDLLGYYSDGETYKEKWVYDTIEQHKIQGQQYKDDELKSIFIYELDNLKRIAKNTTNSKFPLFGWQKEIHTIEYSSNRKTVETTYGGNNNLIRIIKYAYDSLNNPVKLSIFNNQQVLESYETATYDYTHHKYIYTVFNSANELVLREKNYLNNDTTQNLKNSYGDFIQVDCPSVDKTYYTLEYKYDDKGNWIERKMTLCKARKKSKYSVVKRNIEYKNIN